MAYETLCAFRVPGYNVDHLKLNSEPAPPNTMLQNELLDKLVGRVKKILVDSETAGGLKEQLAEKDAELARRDAMLAEKDAMIARLMKSSGDQAQVQESEVEGTIFPVPDVGGGAGGGAEEPDDASDQHQAPMLRREKSH